MTKRPDIKKGRPASVFVNRFPKAACTDCESPNAHGNRVRMSMMVVRSTSLRVDDSV
jgi:hypothetical protein